MALQSRDYVALRHDEYERLCRMAERSLGSSTRVLMSREEYRALLAVVDTKKKGSAAPALLRVALTLATLLACLVTGCTAPRYWIDPSERLAGLKQSPLAPSAPPAYTLVSMQQGDTAILRVRRQSVCSVAEQRVYEWPDVAARRMRQRYETHILEQPVPCEDRPAAHVRLATCGQGQRRYLGQTDDEGQLIVDAEEQGEPECTEVIR